METEKILNLERQHDTLRRQVAELQARVSNLPVRWQGGGVATVSVIWGRLQNPLSNEGFVNMELDKFTKDENAEAGSETGTWEPVLNEDDSPKLVRVTARNVPSGKRIPADSVVGASQIASGIYCVLVSDCPTT